MPSNRPRPALCRICSTQMARNDRTGRTAFWLIEIERNHGTKKSSWLGHRLGLLSAYLGTNNGKYSEHTSKLDSCRFRLCGQQADGMSME